MIVRRIFLMAASVTALSTVIWSGGQAAAQDPFSDSIDPIERINMFDSIEPSPSSSLPSSQTEAPPSQRSVAELRQARALYRANQRVARLEYNLWAGYEPLRPKWRAVPMMTSRYSPRTIYVPVYVRSR